MTIPARLLALMLTLGLLNACGGGGGGSTSNAGVDNGTGSSNAAPAISGQPGTSVVAGRTYSFQPSAQDPEGASLVFAVQNLPAWASFDAASGRLWGSPTDAALGSYANITISVSDGRASASLNPFTIDVVAFGTGSATLSWTPPDSNIDGSPLVDLAGYRVLYGQAPNELTETIDILDPSLSSYYLENLTSGTWYFALVAINRGGAASGISNVASKTVS